jgi:hypothetical protein
MNLAALLLSLFFTAQAHENCAILKEAYAGSVKTCGGWVMELHGKKTIPYFTGFKKSIEERMENPDVFSAFFDAYRSKLPRQDGGRVRLYPLLEETYGKTEKEIKANLVKVKFLNQILWFNKKNGAAEALAQTGKELEALLEKNPHLSPWLSKPETFYYRKIAGTALLSSHSFGIALDIGVESSRYWRWDGVLIPENEALVFPLSIIEIFEKHGFIWGGYWKHYDSMHFEYRPEFLTLKKSKGDDQ